MGIQAIPIEIAFLIASYLDPEDLFHWALSCRQFGYLIRDNAVCRASLRARPYSGEWQRAASSFCYARALRTHVKRRAAVRQAKPFAVSVVDGGSSFVYANGALCYTCGQSQMRFINFNQPEALDWSFDFRQLLLTRIPRARRCQKHKLRPLHYAEGFVSCLYSSRSEQSASTLHWLVIIDVNRQGILTVCELDRIDDLWVRNSSEWLYCGISAETEDEDVRTWVLFQFDAQKKHWASNRVLLPNMPHGDMGVGNCFDIFDGHLYGASSRMAINFDSYESQTWNSFYYIFRFPLGDSASVEVMDMQESWRRRPADGNVDDRWGFLQLAKEDTTGDIYLYESRREFLETRPQSQRNCYRKRVSFRERQPDDPHSWESRQSDDWDSEGFKDDIRLDDVHHGDDWYRDTTYAIREVPIRTYIPSCRSFLDVIAPRQDPAIDRSPLHIRARPRDQCHGSPRDSINSVSLATTTESDEPAPDQGVNIWPTQHDLLLRDEQLTGLLDMLCPDPAAQELVWYADERFIVYALEPVGSKLSRHIVIVSFDPSVRVPGTRGWYGPHAASMVDGGKFGEDGVGGLPLGEDLAALTPSTGSSDTSCPFGLDFSRGSSTLSAHATVDMSI